MPSIFSSTRYANITATAALVLALGGTSYAAVQVTGGDVKNGSLTGKDIKKESLGTKQIKGLQASDFTDGIPAGPAGPAGSAKAYARVSAAGVLDAANSSGLAVVIHPFTGLTCMNYLGGAPKNVMATIDLAGADARKSIATVLLGEASMAGVGCPVGSDFAVFTADTATVTQANWAFYVAVIA
jgi:hypothetical protein